MQRSSLIDSAVALAAITAFLYAASTAYYDGYFATFLLDRNVLDRNFQESLYRGFIISFYPAFIILWIYAAVCYLHSHYLLPDLSDWLQYRWGRKRRFLKLKHLCLGTRKDSESVRHYKKHTYRVILYAIFFTIVLFALAHFEEKGKETATADLKKIENNSFQPADLISIKIEDTSKQLFLLNCGARNCAGIEPKTKVVYYFSQNGHSYQFMETKEKIIPPSTGKTP
ncbi:MULTISPECIES: hypothetical protein [Methylomonas]|uniref:RDD domain-containing protein n=1 Tax=Methylomonas methanica TaxID=421 RepID=A0ABY2CFI3_METMH|nr:MULTISPECIES: hypothetical protein [Methylomonas]OAH97552.1 hypothetical protein A1342_19145 [Methylomonas methanica]TCV73873.1 hypothetical protein EDE11_1428 [Methylomonas methanica]